jgi:endonuclease/exonuclease/phosphatase family metal-dependent hydrolase
MADIPTLAEIVTDPKYNFLSQFNSESNDYLDYNFTEANDNPFESLSISCNYFDEVSYVNKFKNLNKFSMFSLNVQSLSSKYNDLKELINYMGSYSCSPDIICLQETWKIFDSAYFTIPNYSPLYVKSRENRQGGGVGLYFKNGLQFCILNEKSIFMEFVIETIVAEVLLPNRKKIAVVSIYRPATPHPTLSQKDQFEQFLELLTNLINELQNLYSDIYIMGDLNIDVLKYESVSSVQDYVDLLFSFGLLQIITRPTRCAQNTATLIDHAILSPKSSSCESAILTSKISDHFPIIYFFDNVKCKREEKTLTYRDFSSRNIQRFKETLSNFSWNSVLGDEDTQLAFNNFNDTISNFHDLFFPVQTKRFNRNINPVEKWMTKGLLISRNTKFKLSHKCTSEPSSANSAAYKIYRNCYNKTIRAARKYFYENQLQVNKSNLKKHGKFLKRQ